MPENGIAFDPTVTLSTIVALAAIISPVLVALINNHHQYRMKKLELLTSQKEQVIRDYLRCVGDIIDVHSLNKPCDYVACKGLLYMHIPRASWAIVDKLDREIENLQLDEARKTFPLVCKELANALK